MAYYLSPVFQDAQFISSTADFAVGYKLYTYVAGTSTNVTTYQDNAGSASHANPIVLNSRGEPSAPIWLASGTAVKFVLKTDADVTVRTIDNVYGIGDTAVASTGSSTQEWEAFSGTPTYVSSSSFRVSGNQTSTFHVGRRVKMTVSGGTSYSTVTASSYSDPNTTVTVSTTGSSGLDSSINSLTSFSVGILRADNHSLPTLIDSFPIRSGSSDKTKKWAVNVDNLSFSDTTATWEIPRVTSTWPLISSYNNYGIYNGALQADISAGALIVSAVTNGLGNASSSDPLFVPHNQRSTTSFASIISPTSVTSTLSLTISSGSSLGAISNVPVKIWIGIVVKDSSNIQLAAIVPRTVDASNRITGLLRIRDNDFYSTTTAEGGAGAADSGMVLYSTSAITNVYWRTLGYILATWNGSWSSITHYQTWVPGMLMPGDVAQVIRTDNVAYTSGTTTVPNDDTIPTNSEGNQIATLSITPRTAGNALRTRAGAMCSVNGAGEYITAFVSDGTNAIVAQQSSQGANDPQCVSIEYFEALTSGSAVTRTFRGGATSGANTFAVNGHTGARKLGGVMNAFVQAEEIVL